MGSPVTASLWVPDTGNTAPVSGCIVTASMGAYNIQMHYMFLVMILHDDFQIKWLTQPWSANIKVSFRYKHKEPMDQVFL